MGLLVARNTQKTEEGDTESFWKVYLRKKLSHSDKRCRCFSRRRVFVCGAEHPLGTISVPPSSSRSVFGAASGGGVVLAARNTEGTEEGDTESFWGEFMGGFSNLEWTLLEKEGRQFVCGAEHPSRNNLRASFLRALRVWRRQRWLLAVGSFQQ